MTHPHVVYLLARQRQADLLATADRDRLARAGRTIRSRTSAISTTTINTSTAGCRRAGTVLPANRAKAVPVEAQQVEADSQPGIAIRP